MIRLDEKYQIRNEREKAKNLTYLGLEVSNLRGSYYTHRSGLCLNGAR
jgi:hypothetical protein